MSATAMFTRSLDDFKGNAALYRLSKPVDYEGNEQTCFVVVSDVIAFDHGGPETYIFPADEDGNILDWTELNGSYRGGRDHKHALANAGYIMES